MEQSARSSSRALLTGPVILFDANQVLLEANRTPGVWRINANYNTIGRLLLRRPQAKHVDLSSRRFQAKP